MTKKREVSEFTIHHRHLPHWEEPGATYHIVFRLRDRGVCTLCRDDIAPIVLGALEHYANKRYYLYEHTVMPDHVHCILQPIEHEGTVESLGDIVGDVKSYTARKINDVLGRKGSLWLDESYDHIIRSEDEYQKTTEYIFLNPVRAGQVEGGEDWKWWRPGIEPDQ